MDLKLNAPKELTFIVAALVAIAAIVCWVVAKVVANPPDVALEAAPILAIVAWAIVSAGNMIKGL